MDFILKKTFYIIFFFIININPGILEYIGLQNILQYLVSDGAVNIKKV